MRPVVNRFSAEGVTILDPFMGSGTTLLVAKQLVAVAAQSGSKLKNATVILPLNA